MKRLKIENENALLLLSVNSISNSSSQDAALNPPTPPHSQVEGLAIDHPVPPQPLAYVRDRRNRKQRRAGRRTTKRKHGEAAPEPPPPPELADWCVTTDEEIHRAFIHDGQTNGRAVAGVRLRRVRAQGCVLHPHRREVQQDLPHGAGQPSKRARRS